MPGSEKRSGNQPKLDELISISVAAKMSGLSVSYIRRLVSQGEIWGIKPGRNWLTTMKAVREFMARDRKPGRPKNQ